MRINLFLLIVTVVLILSSCGENAVYQNNHDFKNGKWAAGQQISFDIYIPDTIKAYHLVYTLRNGLDYPYYNLYLQYKLKDSTGNTISENLQELILMDKKTGEPYGSGFGDRYDHQFVSVRDYKFPNEGNYHFNIVHYMRHDSLPEVYSVGLKVVEAD